MSSLAASGDLRASEAAREMAWEQLHSGPWHSVLPIWRDAYSMACLNVAKLHYANGDFKEALRVLDMGLIMGGMTLRKDLDAAVEKVSAKATALKVSEDGTEGVAKAQNHVVPEKFNEAEVRCGSPCFSFAYIMLFNMAMRDLLVIQKGVVVNIYCDFMVEFSLYCFSLPFLRIARIAFVQKSSFSRFSNSNFAFIQKYLKDFLLEHQKVY
ncbi:unnamed protein product [Thlaspi arvense]|uniref:DM8 domain-containing protein n=1 Tax=Thlaspi arvense TaxID=13288 RepID=A0AAU9SN83_THLAR|nr:unnamed protein product [Thlaspi arvense]